MSDTIHREITGPMKTNQKAANIITNHMQQRVGLWCIQYLDDNGNNDDHTVNRHGVIDALHGEKFRVVLLSVLTGRETDTTIMVNFREMMNPLMWMMFTNKDSYLDYVEHATARLDIQENSPRNEWRRMMPLRNMDGKIVRSDGSVWTPTYAEKEE